MEVIDKLIGCCGCGHSEENYGGSRSHTAVIDRQPRRVQTPMAVRMYKSIRQLTTPRRFPRPTAEQLEAFYQEGIELTRLEEEAKQKELQALIKQEETARVMKILEKYGIRINSPRSLSSASDIPPDGVEPFAPLPPPWDVPPVTTASANEKNLPALRATAEKSTLSSTNTADIAAVLAASDSADGSPTQQNTQQNTQTSKKMKLFFQDNRSSIYPSSEESMVYAPGTWSPEIKTPTSRNVSPGNLLIRPLFEVLEQARSPAAVSVVQLKPEVEFPRLPQLAYDQLASPCPRSPSIRSKSLGSQRVISQSSFYIYSPIPEINLSSLPHPDEFELDDIALTPPASPKPKAPEPPKSPLLTGAAYLALELHRIKQRIETGRFDATPWDKPPAEPEPAVTMNNGRKRAYEDLHSTDVIRRSNFSSEESLPYPKPAITRGFYGRVRSLSNNSLHWASFSSSSLSSDRSLSLQALSQINSATFKPSDRKHSSILSWDEDLAGLPPTAETPANHDTADEFSPKTLAENFRKGGETIARGITNGFTSLFKRFGAKTVEIQSPEPQPQMTTAIPSEPVNRSVLSIREAANPLSPTPSKLELTREILGLKVDGNLLDANVAAASSPELAREAMSSGLLTADYTDCLSIEYVNEFDGFNWAATDGKIPRSCDDGVHADEESVPGWLKNYPSEFLRVDPTRPGDEELMRIPVLPGSLTKTSTSTGPKNVRVRQLTPPVAQQETPTAVTNVVVASPAASSAATTTLRADTSPLSPTGSLSSSSMSQTRSPIGTQPTMSEGVRIVSSTSVSSGPRYDPRSHRLARTSTCGLDLSVERAFYMNYEDRLKMAVKSWMRGKPSTQRF
ncbi:hypothetical protein ABW20_dc0106878 [Dactylellina cionopaga]|nr:hypothetical protein ABW20_dc0106878 [Dactylellina cionopaga]